MDYEVRELYLMHDTLETSRERLKAFLSFIVICDKDINSRNDQLYKTVIARFSRIIRKENKPDCLQGNCDSILTTLSVNQRKSDLIFLMPC